MVEIGTKIVSHGRYIMFQMAEVPLWRQMFAEILQLVDGLRTKPPATRRPDLRFDKSRLEC